MKEKLNNYPNKKKKTHLEKVGFSLNKTSQRHMRRFFSSLPLPDKNQSFYLSKEESHHLANVVCLKVGENCLVIDLLGKEVEASVLSVADSQKVGLTVEEVHISSQTFQSKRLIVFQAVPKKAKFDWIVQKSQELGVFQLFPLMSERTIVRIDASKENDKLQRWQKLAIEAAKQSGSRDIVRLESPCFGKEVLGKIKDVNQVLVFHPSKESEYVNDWVRSELLVNKDSDQSVTQKKTAVFIGPEGGFSQKEIDAFGQNAKEIGADFKMLHLGDSILKADTAFIAIVSILKFLL